MKLIPSGRVLGAAALVLMLTGATSFPAWARRPAPSAIPAFELFSREQLSQSLAPCKDQFPGSLPLNMEAFAKERRATGLCFDDFADVYSAQTKTPIVTVERLNRAAIHRRRQPRVVRVGQDPGPGATGVVHALVGTSR